MSKSNIIDLRPYLKRNATTGTSVKRAPKSAAPVIDMTEKREEILSKERRDKRRTILTEFMGAFLVFPSSGNSIGGLQKIFLYDISENGLSFDIDPEVGKFTEGQEVAMRIYLSQKNFLPFIVKVSNIRFQKDEEVYRHGCQFIKGTVNQEALFHLVKFIEHATLDLKVDAGDLLTHSSKK